MKKFASKFYLVGIKGTGMTSLATYLKEAGYYVVGSDTEEEYFTSDILKNKKIETFIFNKNNITSDYIYIISNAYSEANEEVYKIILNDFEYYYYHDFIGKILEKEIIAISGTHGKTTTSFFLTQMLNNNASYIIGDGTGHYSDASNLLVLEACEYKNHFHSYRPLIGLITNIDFDHPDFFKGLDDTVKSFQAFASNSKILVINNDLENTKEIKHNNKVTFGFNKDSDYVIQIINESSNGYQIKVTKASCNNSENYTIPFLGIHNIYNFVSALVVCDLIGYIPVLDNISMPRRRMTKYQYGKTILIDDYAHHPTEINCLINSLRKMYKDYPINAIFQPHTYSRTIKFEQEFIDSLSKFDSVYLENVFSSKREIDGKMESKKLFKTFNKYHKDVLKQIDKRKEEVWVFLGAGVVNKEIANIIHGNIYQWKWKRLFSFLLRVEKIYDIIYYVKSWNFCKGV